MIGSSFVEKSKARMSSRKEEERNEKIIRGLMKLPPNRRCINCNSLGPQYVCTNFWTFVCMTCSGIHREFTHRVKSVSMSKFTTQEVEALQEGGNQRARETFLKDWDPRGQRLPDNSNVDRVREFIKSVYVDKKFFASKLSGKPPRDTLSHRNQEEEIRRASSYHSYSQSPPYDYQYEDRRYGKQAPALTKKPGSDRGMFRFPSTSRLSDHVQEDSFANEVSNARASDYTGNSGGDPFRSDNQSPTYRMEFGFSSPNSDTSRDIFNEDVEQRSVNTFSNSKAKGDLDQKTGSSGSIAKLNSDGIGFRSVDSIDKDYITPTPEHSAAMQHNKDSTLPAASHSSDSAKFDGLDLFSAPYLPQSTTSVPSAESGKFDGLDLFSSTYAPQSTKPASSAIDLFELSTTASVGALSRNTSQPLHNSAAPTSSVNQQFKAFEPSSLDLFAFMPHQQSAETLKDNSPDMISQKNEGWASFDMPWHAEPSRGSKNSITVSETATNNESLGIFNQASSIHKSSGWSFHQDISTSGPSSLMHNPWQGGVHDFGTPLNATNDQSWNASGESTTPFQSIYTKSNEHILVQEPSIVDPYLAWGISENFNMKQTDVGTRSAPFLSTTPNAIGTSHSSSELPVMDGAQSHGVDRKSRNPFDFSSDADLDSSNMFLDVSSLQSALPNHNVSTTAWFPESAVLPLPYGPGKSQDALAFMAVQAPSMQISNIQGQGPVASVSGNPFG